MVVGRSDRAALLGVLLQARQARRRVDATIAHFDHIHIGLNKMGAARLTSFWRSR